VLLNSRSRCTSIAASASWGSITSSSIRAVPRRRRRGPPGTPWPALTGARERDRTARRPHPARIPVLQRHERTVRHLHRAGRPRSPGTARPAAARAYRAAFPHAGPEELVETVYSDALFRMPSQKLAEANAAAGGASYLFRTVLGCPGPRRHPGRLPQPRRALAFGALDQPRRHPAHRRGAQSRGRRALPPTSPAWFGLPDRLSGSSLER
jgi:para-nitrobenzyl esterase